MSVILPIIFAVVLLSDRRGRTGMEKYIYIALAVIAVLLALPAGILANYDHVGASLSGVISIFMR